MRRIKNPERFERELTREQLRGLQTLHWVFQTPHLRAEVLRATLYKRRATAPRKTHHHRAAGSKMLKRANRLFVGADL